MSTTSPSQQGGEGTDSEEVWMITEESAILVMYTSLIGKDLYPSLKGGTFYVCSLQATSRCAIRGPWNSLDSIMNAGRSSWSSTRSRRTSEPNARSYAPRRLK